MGLAVAIITLVHLDLHQLCCILGRLMDVHLFILELRCLLHQILTTEGHSVFQLFLHLFKIHELALLLLVCLQIVELLNI